MGFPNPYKARLKEFSEFVFDEDDLTRMSGRWRGFFHARTGIEPNRLVLEIGCSNAFFLGKLAQANPRDAFVGLDWKYKVLYKGAKRVESEKIANLSLIRGVAQKTLPVGFGARELDEIWVFFPDPWAKKAQLKHRLLQDAFFAECARVLKSGGKLHIKTDHPGYFQCIAALCGRKIAELPDYSVADPTERSRRARQMLMRTLAPEELPAESCAIANNYRLTFLALNYWNDQKRPATLFSETQTLFERGFVEQKLPIYYFELTKN